MRDRALVFVCVIGDDDLKGARMGRRLQIVRHWLSGSRNEVSLPEMLGFLCGRTCAQKARSRIRSIVEQDEYVVVYLNCLERPLYYPKEFDLHSLYQVIAELLYPADWHYYEIEQTRVGPEDVVVDCGAAEGLFSLIVATRCSRVYAIDPVPRFVASMGRTFSGIDNVKVLPLALSDEEGTAYISGHGISSSISSYPGDMPVAVTTLDDLFFKKNIPVSYIKADLEGHDVSMLKGAKETIKQYSPKIAVTTYHAADHAEAIAGYLRAINPRYHFKVKGVEERCGAPVMLHAWVE